MLAAGAVGVAAIAFTGSASAEQAQAAKPAKLKMAIKGTSSTSSAAETVEKGQKLKIINKTRVNEVGPHTFTLVKPELIDSAKERKRCERLESKRLPEHPRGAPGRPAARLPGRQAQRGQAARRAGTRSSPSTKKGDSWFTDQRGATETRKVRAEVGDTLGYFCVVHPFMRGKLEVE